MPKFNETLAEMISESKRHRYTHPYLLIAFILIGSIALILVVNVSNGSNTSYVGIGLILAGLSIHLISFVTGYYEARNRISR